VVTESTGAVHGNIGPSGESIVSAQYFLAQRIFNDCKYLSKMQM